MFEINELKSSGVKMILYPLSAFRAMSKAAEEIYEELAEQETLKNKLKKMQSRDELYDVLNYHMYEKKIDELFSKE
jgi:methylisocitrate lyase